MTDDEALKVINNLDWKDNARKYAPQWSLVTISREGVILDVQRFKETPQTKEQTEILKRFSNSFQFTSYPGQLKTVDELRHKIQESVRTIECVESKENQGKRWVRMETDSPAKQQ